jgi:hypothetical protein
MMAYNSTGSGPLSNTVYFTVTAADTASPSGSWITPTTGDVYPLSGTLNLSVTASDDVSMSRVTFHAYYDNAWHDIGADTHGGNGTYSLCWKYSVSAQDVLIHAHLYDATGNYTNLVGPTVTMASIPTAPIVATAVSGKTVTTSWSGATGTITHYWLLIENSAGNEVFSQSIGLSTSYTGTFSDGVYKASVTPYNGTVRGSSGSASFTVKNTYTVTFIANGGSVNPSFIGRFVV